MNNDDQIKFPPGKMEVMTPGFRFMYRGEEIKYLDNKELEVDAMTHRKEK